MLIKRRFSKNIILVVFLLVALVTRRSKRDLIEKHCQLGSKVAEHLSQICQIIATLPVTEEVLAQI